jgi:hypothetical protein
MMNTRTAASFTFRSEKRPTSLPRTEDTRIVRRWPAMRPGMLIVPPGDPSSADLINSASRCECAGE